MNIIPMPNGRRYSRREILALAAGIGAAAALPAVPALAAESLRTRAIPRSGEPLPVVGLGTAIVFDIGEHAVRRTERRAVIQTLLDGGGRLIDTAPSYGNAELVVGDLVSAMSARPKVFLATKVRATDRANALDEMQQSLRRLRTDKVDLMQLHNEIGRAHV
jgi:aryl-alcohol dehydrogenase-like predicted oxidoreductase